MRLVHTILYPVKKIFDLEDRLVRFAVSNIKLSSTLYYSTWRHHISSQLIRSGNSAALNYGEAQGAESKRDFQHKLRLVLKELRETSVSLKIIKEAELSKDLRGVNKLLKESDELIAIFVKSLNTSSSKNSKTS